MSQRHEDFHAHIYFTPSQMETARRLRVRAVDNLERGIWLGPLHHEPLGPHPIGMFEIQFSRRAFRQVLDWLVAHRGEHSVLVHEVTGDDPRDHEEGALWLGAALPLDFSKLDPSPQKTTETRAALTTS
jgi:aromatic ring-cleaving dioxygenase